MGVVPAAGVPNPPCPQVFIRDLVQKLQGLQKQEELHNNGIQLPQLHVYSSRPGSADRTSCTELRDPAP